MPNITALSVMPDTTTLVAVTYGPNASTASVSVAEAQSYIDSHPSQTNAQIEAQIVSLIQSRWTGRTDTVSVHLVQRSPVQVAVLITQPGASVPSNWWVN